LLQATKINIRILQEGRAEDNVSIKDPPKTAGEILEYLSLNGRLTDAEGDLLIGQSLLEAGQYTLMVHHSAPQQQEGKVNTNDPFSQKPVACLCLNGHRPQTSVYS